MWIEAQSWWTDAGEEADIANTSRHFHIGACMPYNQTVSGVITIDVLLQVHNNQDHMVKEVYFLAPLPYNATGIITDISNHKVGSTGIIDFACPLDLIMPYTCMKVYRIQVNTSLVPFDCVAPLRLRAETALRPGVAVNLDLGNGYTYTPELSVRMRFSNGKPACPAKRDPNRVPEAPTISTAFNDFPWGYTRMSIIKDALPTKLVRGNWTIKRIESFDQRLEGRVSPVVTPVTRTFITLNPRFHLVTNGSFTPFLGTPLLDVPGMVARDLTIDTTKLLNGRNIFFMRTDSTIPKGAILPDTIPWLPGVTHPFTGGVPHPGGTTSAVLVFAFFVDNPPPPPL